MALKYSTAVKQAKLNAIETTTGTSPVLNIYTGSVPADLDTAASGTLLAALTLPSDWLAAAGAAGQVVTKAKAGTWEDTSANAAGTAGYFRIVGTLAGSNLANIEGTITATAGGGDMTLDNIVLAAGQDVIITGFTLTSGN